MRRNPRVLLDVDVEVVQGDTRLVGRAHDISLGGMFVASATPAGFGAHVTVVFRIPGGDREMSIAGTVRWTRGDGMGVQFGTFGVRETYAITEWVKKHEATD
jgi:hypothetical protein